jgi:putative membrane protein
VSTLTVALRALRPVRAYHLFIAAWVLAMIAQPVLRWLYGERFLSAGVVVAVVLQAGAVLAVLVPAWGVRRTAVLALGVGVMTWGIEYLGSTTGVPFGQYHYTDRLQPQVGGVPLIIPLAWLMMLPSAWAVAHVITRRFGLAVRGGAFVVLSALAFTAWDLFLDPQMVKWGFWVWDQPGEYFGIPLVNYGGWLLSSATITVVIFAVLRPPALPVGPLLLVYGITWALESIGLAVFWGMPGPALFGFVGMGIMVYMAYSIHTAYMAQHTDRER